MVITEPPPIETSLRTSIPPFLLTALRRVGRHHRRKDVHQFRVMVAEAYLGAVKAGEVSGRWLQHAERIVADTPHCWLRPRRKVFTKHQVATSFWEFQGMLEELGKASGNPPEIEALHLIAHDYRNLCPTVRRGDPPSIMGKVLEMVEKGSESC